MVVTVKEIGSLLKNQEVKMIAIKLDCQSDTKEDFFIK
jgi:hypothetical protein